MFCCYQTEYFLLQFSSFLLAHWDCQLGFVFLRTVVHCGLSLLAEGRWAPKEHFFGLHKPSGWICWFQCWPKRKCSEVKGKSGVLLFPEKICLYDGGSLSHCVDSLIPQLCSRLYLSLTTCVLVPTDVYWVRGCSIEGFFLLWNQKRKSCLLVT